MDYNAFLKKEYWEEILTLAHGFQNRKTLTIDFEKVREFDLEGGNRLLEQPEQELKAILKALSELDLPGDYPGDYLADAHIAIRNLYGTDMIPIHQIGYEHHHKLISIEGVITKKTDKTARILEAAFECKKCGEITRMPQDTGELMQPFECENEPCGRKGSFKLIHENSILADAVFILLHGLYDSEFLKPGHQVGKIKVDIQWDDLIKDIPALGAQCIITGIVQRVPPRFLRTCTLRNYRLNKSVIFARRTEKVK